MSYTVTDVMMKLDFPKKVHPSEGWAGLFDAIEFGWE
jgi:hypothetical protein